MVSVLVTHILCDIIIQIKLNHWWVDSLFYITELEIVHKLTILSFHQEWKPILSRVVFLPLKSVCGIIFLNLTSALNNGFDQYLLWGDTDYKY